MGVYSDTSQIHFGGFSLKFTSSSFFHLGLMGLEDHRKFFLCVLDASLLLHKLAAIHLQQVLKLAEPFLCNLPCWEVRNEYC